MLTALEGPTLARKKADSSLVEKVLTDTRRRILNGDYAPGTRLRIKVLEKASNVSAIPVREALRLLEAERLVESIPNKGPVVTALSIDDLNDLYTVRLQLEPLAISTTKRLSKNEAESLTNILANMESARESGDHDKVIDLHRLFHFQLYERSDSVWLPHLIAMLWTHAERYQWLTIEPRSDEASAEHHAILHALEEGDANEAAAILSGHLEATRRLLAATLSALDDQRATAEASTLEAQL